MGVFSWANPVGNLNALAPDAKDVLEKVGKAASTINANGPELIKTAKNTLNAGKNLADTAQIFLGRVERCAQLLTAFTGFAAAASGVCAIANTLQGASAERHLAAIGKEMAAHLKTMSSEMKDINKAAQIGANMQYQTTFAQHVHDFVALHSDRAAASLLQEFFFVYHLSNEWHGAFNRLLKSAPIPALCGFSENLNVLMAFLPEFRKTVGPDAKIHILLPTAHLYVLPDVLTVPSSIGTIYMSGDLHHSGNPYVHLTVQNLEAVGCQGIKLIQHLATTTSSSPTRGLGMTILKHTSSVAAGVGAGVGGACLSVVVMGVGVAICPPLVGAALFGEFCFAGTLLGGAVAGTTTGISVRRAFK